MADNNKIDLRRHFRTFLSYIWISVIILICAIGIGIAFACISQPRYNSEALLLIEDNSDETPKSSGLLNLVRTFAPSGGLGSASIDNEVLLLSSRDVTKRTVDALRLNIEVSEKNGLAKKLLFNNSPFEVKLTEGLAENLTKPIAISIKPAKNGWGISVKEGVRFGKEIFSKTDINLPYTISVPEGVITIEEKSGESVKAKDYLITIENPVITADNLYKNVKVEPRDKTSDAIILSITDIGKERGGAILNEMMNQYNIKRLERRQENALTELDFLNDRIAGISQELSAAEKEIERYKTEKQFVDIKSEAPILLGVTLDSHKDLLITSAEIAYYEQVLGLLESGSDGLLPAIAIPGENSSNGPNELISSYNKEVMAVKELEKSALPGNSALERANQRLQHLKGSIVESFSQLLTNAKLSQAKQSGATGKIDDKLKNMPVYEREFYNLYRDNLLKNELYSYLTEKRENALLQYYSLSTLGFVIDKAHTEVKPSLKRPAIFIIGIVLFAVILIVVLVIVLTKRNQMVCDTMDLADLGLEENSLSVHSDSQPKAADTVRSWLTADKKPKVVYISQLNGTENASIAIKTSFSNAEIPFEVIGQEFNSNDPILSPKTNLRISSLLKEGKYVFISVPQPERTDMLSTEINTEEGRLLLFIADKTISRKELYSITQPIFESHTFTVLIKG